MSFGIKSRGMFAVVLAGALFSFAGRAHAQEIRGGRVMINMTDGPMSGGGSVSKRSVEKYADLLQFNSDQRDSAFAIHEGYTSSFKEVQKARNAAMEEINRSAQDSGDHSVFMEKMPAINKEFREKSQKLEKSLFDDLKALCADSAQETRWPKVERMRRREVELRRGSVAGEGVDLIEITNNLKLAEPVLASISSSLDEYEVEIDGQIKARQKINAEAPTFEPGKPLNMEAFQKSMGDSREAGLKIKDVNDRYARKIGEALPAESQAAFRAAVRAATFPQVYRRSPIARDLDKALALKDLSNEQRSALAGLKSSYEKDVKPLNEAWASAIEAADKTDGGAGGLPSGGGGTMMIRMNDEPEPLKQAKKARREFDDKARATINKTLNETQQAAIKPAPGEGGEEGFEVTDNIVIRGVR